MYVPIFHKVEVMFNQLNYRVMCTSTKHLQGTWIEFGLGKVQYVNIICLLGVLHNNRIA